MFESEMDELDQAKYIEKLEVENKELKEKISRLEGKKKIKGKTLMEVFAEEEETNKGKK